MVFAFALIILQYYILRNLLIVGVAQFFPSVPVILQMFAEFVVRLVVLSHGSFEVRCHLEHEIPDFQTHLFYVPVIHRLECAVW